MKLGTKGKIAAAILSVGVFSWILSGQMAKGAVFDESRAVTYEEYASSHVIEDSTLFIGTYIIHIQALTDELYEKAMDSATDSNQTRIYYKSELAGGAWFDITDAAGLSDISDQGTVIPESELADLWVTCYTGSDGITRDVKSDEAISIFDTPDPYDLYNLPELEPIRLQYDNAFSPESTGMDKYYYTKLREFFELDLRNEITAMCDQQLAGLQICYESLQSAGKTELAEIVSTLMSRIDARRRAEIFSQLSVIDDNYLTNLQNVCSSQGFEKDREERKNNAEDSSGEDVSGGDSNGEDVSGGDSSGEDSSTEDSSAEDSSTRASRAEGSGSEDGEDGSGEDSSGEGSEGEGSNGEDSEGEDSSGEDGDAEDGEGEDGDAEDDDDKDSNDKDLDDDIQYVENVNVTDAIGTSLQSCWESYIEHSGKMLEPGETVLKNAEYEKSMQVVGMSTEGWNAQMETLLLQLQDIYHIQDDIVADAERELALLDGELLGTAENKYLQILSQGAGGAYQAAVANGVSQAAKNQVLDDRKSVANGAKSEFQYLILAKTERMPAADAVEYLYQRIDQAETFYDQAASDDFRIKAGETIDDHILWLQNQARSISSEEEELQSELQKLESRKEELLEGQADALDNNNLSTARKYEALIALVDEEIGVLEQELNAILTSSSSSAAEKAQAANQAGDSTALNNINQMKNSALSMIASGDISENDSLGNLIDGLASLGAESALKEIRDKVADSGNSQLLKDIDRAIEDSKESSLHDLYGGGGTTDTGAAGSGTDGTGSGSDGTGSGIDGTGSGSDETGSGTDGTGSGTDGTGSGIDGMGSGTGGAGSGLREGDIQAAIEAVFGDTFDNLDDVDKATVTAALNRVGQSGSRQAANLAQTFLNQCVNDGNAYVYQKLKRESAEYIPLRVIGLCCGYRYVYSDSKKEVTLTKKSNVYHFTVYSDQMALQDGSQEKLTASVKVQSIPYLAEEDAIACFQCQAEYIDNTDYGVALSAQMQKRAQELVDALQEGEG